MKRARQRFVICVEIADDNGAVAEMVAAADEFQDFARAAKVDSISAFEHATIRMAFSGFRILEF